MLRRTATRVADRVAARVAATVVVAAAGGFAFAGPVSAHVSVTPSTAEPGSFAQLSFRVPNERDNASTTQIQVMLPTDPVLQHVSVQPVAGWTVTTQEQKLDKPVATEAGQMTTAISQVTWRGGKIEPGQFQRFDISVGPLPEQPGELAFKAVQTYSNGEVVRWIEVPAEGGAEGAAEPQYPAPVLTVAPAAASTAATSTGESATTDTSDGTAAGDGTEVGDATVAGGPDLTARVLGGAGLVAALLAIAVTWQGRRKPAAEPATRVSP